MAGPLDIQRLPFGLVDLLGMKGSGSTPYNLAEAIAVTLADGADYYLAPRRTVVFGNSAVDLSGSGFFAATGVLVPATEIWLVYSITSTLNQATAAATAAKFAGGVLRAGASQALQLTEMVTCGAADIGAEARVFERPSVWLPGDQFGTLSHVITGAAAVRGQIRIDVARLTL